MAERRGAVTRRRRSELSLLDWIPDGVVVSDDQGRIVFANTSVERMTGYRRKELAGHPIGLLVPAEVRSIHSRRRCNHPPGRVDRTPMGEERRDFQVRRKYGSDLFADIALSAIKTGDGHPTIAVIHSFYSSRR